MSEREDVVRWSSDPRAPEGMRALLRAANAADHGPSPAELASLRARMGAQLATTTAAGKTAALVTARTIIIGMLVIGAGAGIVGALASRPDPQVAVPIARFVPPPPAPVPPTPPPTVAPAAAVVPPPPPPPRHVAPRKRAHTEPVAAEPAPAPAPAPPPRVSEVALLEQARSALRGGQAARSLALTDQHAALYADGILVEEREALAIEALLELGRRDEAAAKWSKFAAAYPHSNYQARLQRKIDRVQ